jgi:hypothetical protein
MKFQLGESIEPIVTINDGGLGIQYLSEEGNNTRWQPGGIRPFLSLEVNSFSIVPSNGEAKRFVSKRTAEDILSRHAGQVFCEMLGQTCYPEFYENKAMEYQEVPVSQPPKARGGED